MELHAAILESEQSIVAALADVSAGMDMGTTLADQHVAGQNELTISTLHTQALGSRPLRVEPTPFLWAKNCRPIFSICYTSMLSLSYTIR